MENPEKNPCWYGLMIFDFGCQDQWGKSGFSTKCAGKTGHAQQQKELGFSPTAIHKN